MKFVWDLSEEDWNKYPELMERQIESDPDGIVNPIGVLGCCHVGDLCFDIRAWGEKGKYGLGYELFVGGVDNNYSETADGRPYDMVDEYDEFPISVLKMECEDFKKLAEKIFEKFIIDVAPRYKLANLIDKANEELKVW